QTLATRSAEESVVRVWNVASGVRLRQFLDLSSGNPRLSGLSRPGLSFASDNRTLAVNCDDGTVHLLDVTTGRKLRVLGESKRGPAVGGGGGQRGRPCLGFAFAPDGRSLAASHAGLPVRLWEVVSGRERARFTGHAGFVMA